MLGIRESLDPDPTPDPTPFFSDFKDAKNSSDPHQNVTDPQHCILPDSVADPDVYPGSDFFPSRIRIKEFKYFNPPKNGF